MKEYLIICILNQSIGEVMNCYLDNLRLLLLSCVSMVLSCNVLAVQVNTQDNYKNIPASLSQESLRSIQQQIYLKSSNSQANDYFSWAMDMSGDTLVVSAYTEASNATGVDGDQNNNTIGSSGAVYVFINNAGVWSQQAYIKASNTGSLDLFGHSVAIDGDTLVVGAIGERSNAVNVDGNQADDSLAQAGAAYVFVRSGTTWSQQAYLKASNPDSFDQFGYSVGVSGDTVVVGALQEDSNTTGINGNQNDTATNTGAVYVYVRSGVTWTPQAYIKASNTGNYHNFGKSVAIEGETIAVGAPNESSGSTGINGIQVDTSATSSGAVYVFVRNTNMWSQQAYVKASNTGSSDEFGWSLDLSNETLVVGAYKEKSSTTGINGNQADDNALYAGAAYVFTRSTNTWSQQAYIKASNTDAEDKFGYDVAISGDNLIVGAIWEASASTGVNGLQTNESFRAGAAYVYSRTGTDWSQQAYLKASNTDDSDEFGNSVTVSGDVFIAGSVRESSNATGIDGNANNDLAGFSGAAYIYTPVTGFTVGGTITGLDNAGTVTLQNNATDDLLISNNGAFTFDFPIADSNQYDVTVSISPNNPIQTCLVSGGNSGSDDGTGTIAGTNDDSIVIACNTEPTLVADSYTINEDTILTANDANGSVNGSEDDGVLANDSDDESDTLTVVDPGTYVISTRSQPPGNIGGTITINADGTFVYAPPTDANGQAFFDYDVTDGINTVSSSLTINVLSVNDVPTFSVDDFTDGFGSVSVGNTQLHINNFVSNIVLGPDNESSQQILQFDTVIVSDPDQIINNINVNNDGSLDVDFSLNSGFATIGLSLQDDGGIDNSGIDTLLVAELIIAYEILVFDDSFESIITLKSYLDGLKALTALNDFPQYDYNNGTLYFYGRILYIDKESKNVIAKVKYWLINTIKAEAPNGDFDQDGVNNVDDTKPFNFD